MGGTNTVKDRTSEKVDAYAPPAIERREDVKGLLNPQAGSYKPPGIGG